MVATLTRKHLKREKEKRIKKMMEFLFVEETQPQKLNFFQFLVKYRPNYNYNAEYSYLKKPLELALQNEKEIIFCKGSQVGVTEAFLSYTLFQLYQNHKNIFYMLPTGDEVSDFSAARFNPIIEQSEELSKAFLYDNVHHKRCGTANLYLRGGNSPSKIKSVPVKLLIIDEIDEIPSSSIDIVEERLAGSLEKQIIKISTPTLPDLGIWKEYKNSEQYKYEITCQCGEKQSLTFEDNLDIADELLHCRKCKRSWTHKEKTEMIIAGEWQKKSEGQSIGFHISQLYSSTVTTQEICQKYKKIDSETKKQVFMNHKLGLPYVSEGAKLTGELVDSRLGNITNTSNCYAGIDVSQSNYHYIVIVSSHDAGVIVETCFRATWEDMKKKLEQWKVRNVIIDANPERHSARKFQESLNIGCLLALYPPMKELFAIDEQKQMIKISRTEIIDIVFERFRSDHIMINERVLQGEYQNFKKHLCSTTRQYREKKEGIFEAFYREVGDDHYLHALCYAEIASRFQGVRNEFAGNFLK